MIHERHHGSRGAGHGGHPTDSGGHGDAERRGVHAESDHRGRHWPRIPRMRGPPGGHHPPVTVPVIGPHGGRRGTSLGAGTRLFRAIPIALGAIPLALDAGPLALGVGPRAPPVRVRLAEGTLAQACLRRGDGLDQLCHVHPIGVEADQDPPQGLVDLGPVDAVQSMQRGDDGAVQSAPVDVGDRRIRLRALGPRRMNLDVRVAVPRPYSPRSPLRPGQLGAQHPDEHRRRGPGRGRAGQSHARGVIPESEAERRRRRDRCDQVAQNQVAQNPAPLNHAPRNHARGGHSRCGRCGRTARRARVRHAGTDATAHAGQGRWAAPR